MWSHFEVLGEEESLKECVRNVNMQCLAFTLAGLPIKHSGLDLTHLAPDPLFKVWWSLRDAVIFLVVRWSHD